MDINKIDDTNKDFIQNDLLPNLIKTGVISSNFKKLNQIENCEIGKIGVSEAFMATLCYRIKLTLTDNFKSKFEKIGLILKATPPMDEATFKMTNFEVLFENEIIAYKEMFPILNWTNYLAKYYYSELKHLEAKILLSDFTLDGFRMSKDKGNLSLEHCLEAVKVLGKFHGIAYALKQTNRNEFNSLIGKFKESRYHTNDFGVWTDLVQNGPKRAMLSVREHQNECNVPEEFLQKLEEIFKDVMGYGKNIVQPIEPMAILCHGDFLRNNIAFKYCDEENDIPDEAIMFDFQTIRYSSPMCDLTTFMANSTGIDVRSKYFHNIFNAYHTELSKNYCLRTDTNVNELPDYLSYDSMLKEYIRIMPYGFSIACSFIAMCFEPIDYMSMDFQADAQKILEAEFNRGGEKVNRELRALVCDMYNFYTKYEIELK